jgi:hypothetical protein
MDIKQALYKKEYAGSGMEKFAEDRLALLQLSFWVAGSARKPNGTLCNRPLS